MACLIGIASIRNLKFHQSLPLFPKNNCLPKATLLSSHRSVKAPFLSNPYRLFTTSNKTICSCGAQLPEIEHIVSLFRERKLRQLTKEVPCRYFKSFHFAKTRDCKLIDKVEEIAIPLLREFNDVIHIGNTHFVMFEALKEIPDGNLANLTGDHGKQLVKFLRDCLNKKLISEVGSVFDIGGQNTSTVSLVADLLNNPKIPCVIIDINSTTPAVSDQKSNMSYVIDNGFDFFSSQRYQDLVKDIINKNPSLFIFNNMLNVLKAEDGWKTLEATWERLRSGDYLVISGLVPEQLKKHGFKLYHQVDGIAEFHHETKGFYKSALSSNFFEFVKIRLVGSSVLLKETFKFTIEMNPTKLEETKGRRLLTLKKL